MAQNTSADEIAPLTDKDLKDAADGHAVAVDELREAVALFQADLDEYADEWADNEVPEGHGDYNEPTVIWQDDEHVCIYVAHGSFDPSVDVLQNVYDVDKETAKAVPWAYNAYARRKGASPDGLGAMDAVVLPRTDAVDATIAERE